MCIHVMRHRFDSLTLGEFYIGFISKKLYSNCSSHPTVISGHIAIVYCMQGIAEEQPTWLILASLKKITLKRFLTNDNWLRERMALQYIS